MNLEHLKSRLESQVSGMSTVSINPAARSTARKVVWAFALVALLVWSLLAWAAHVVFSGSADFLLSQRHWFEGYPWLEPWLSGGVGITEGIAIGLTWIVWAVGALLIALGAWLLPKAFALFQGPVAR